METKYLIIGNSVAGVSCIEGIRKIDRNGKILVISRESIRNYSRPLISYYLAGKFSQEDMAFKNTDFYEKNSADLLLNTTALSLDTGGKILTTDKGQVHFEKLLIATGARPYIPEIQGYSKSTIGIWTFMSFSDAEGLKNYIEEKKIDTATVLGGGLIGLKCAEGLLEKGLKIHLVEITDRLLANTLDCEASQIIEEVLRVKGCIVHKRDTIEKIYCTENRVEKIQLKSGQEIKTNLLVIAAGVKPEIDLIKNTPIECNRGILVNQFMQTSVSDIYAAGDVAESRNLLTGENSVIAIWPAAARQGKIAGINMAGGQAIYEGMFPMNAVEIAGLPVISFGVTAPENPANFEIITRRDDYAYRKIVLRNDRVVGCIFLGKIERSGIYAGLIKNMVDVSDFKTHLLDDNFGLLILPEQYRKHMVIGDIIGV